MITILVVRVFVRCGLPLNRFGFGRRPDLHQSLILVVGLAALALVAAVLRPVLEEAVGGTRNLERFAAVRGSNSSLWALLLFSWMFAAFGEEFAFRIVLMRGLAFLFSDTRSGNALAVVLQAVAFGLVHAYQGPVGVAAIFVDGLVFGTMTLAARWSIWPAAIAHGTMNTWGLVGLYQS